MATQPKTKSPPSKIGENGAGGGKGRKKSAHGASPRSQPPRSKPGPARLAVRLAAARAYLDFARGGDFQADPPAALTDPGQRRLYVNLLRGLVRHRRFLEAEVERLAGKPLERLDAEAAAAVMLGAYQLRFLDLPPHAVLHETVALAAPLRVESARGWINALLRRIQREGKRGTEAQGGELPLGVETSHPDWMVERWRDAFGKRRTEEICRANNRYEGAAIRVETRRISPRSLAKRLADEGIPAQPHPLLSGALWVEGVGELLNSRAFAEGLCYVQDVSSQLLMAWTAPLLTGRVLDVCAAPGGKLTHLRGLDVPGRWLVGADRSSNRMGRVRENLRRLRLPATPLLLADGERLPFPTAPTGHSAPTAQGAREDPSLLPEAGHPFAGWDALLVDAPCSATGMIRKYPELKWRKHVDQLPRLAGMQLALLGEAARVLRPGGSIVYVTCSLEREENQDLVEAFLAAHPAFRRRSFHTLPFPPGLSAAGADPASLLSREGDLLLLPDAKRMGLFAALLEKRR